MPKIASTLYQTVDLHLSGTTIYLSVKGFKNLPIVRSSTFRLSSSVHDVVVKIALTIIYFNHLLLYFSFPGQDPVVKIALQFLIL